MHTFLRLFLSLYLGMLAFFASIVTIYQGYAPQQSASTFYFLKDILFHSPWYLYLIIAGLSLSIAYIIHRIRPANHNKRIEYLENNNQYNSTQSEDEFITDSYFYSELQRWSRKWRFSRKHLAIAGCIGNQYLSSNQLPRCALIHAAGIILKNDNNIKTINQVACWLKKQMSIKNPILIHPVYLLTFIADALETQIDRKKHFWESKDKYVSMNKHLCYAYAATGKRVTEAINEAIFKDTMIHFLHEQEEKFSAYYLSLLENISIYKPRNQAFDDFQKLLMSMFDKTYNWITSPIVSPEIGDISIRTILPALFEIVIINENSPLAALLQNQAVRLAQVLLPQWKDRGFNEWKIRIDSATQEEVISRLLPWLGAAQQKDLCESACDILQTVSEHVDHELDETQACRICELIGKMIEHLFREGKGINSSAKKQILIRIHNIPIKPDHDILKSKINSIIDKVSHINSV